MSHGPLLSEIFRVSLTVRSWKPSTTRAFLLRTSRYFMDHIVTSRPEFHQCTTPTLTSRDRFDNTTLSLSYRVERSVSNWRWRLRSCLGRKAIMMNDLAASWQGERAATPYYSIKDVGKKGDSTRFRAHLLHSTAFPTLTYMYLRNLALRDENADIFIKRPMEEVMLGVKNSLKWGRELESHLMLTVKDREFCSVRELINIIWPRHVMRLRDNHWKRHQPDFAQHQTHNEKSTETIVRFRHEGHKRKI